MKPPRSPREGGLGALVPLTILLMLVMLTAWLNRTVELNAPSAPRPVTHDPDYVAQNFTLLRLSDTGETHYSLAAQKLIHYPDDDTANLLLPVLKQLQPGKPELRARAERATVLAKGDEIRLYDNVEVFRAGDKKTAGKKGSQATSDDLRVTTSYLRVRPDDDHADTPAQVVLESGISTLIGTGMDFDNRYRNVRLHSAVTAHYVKRPS